MDALNTLGITGMGFISQLVNFLVIMAVLTLLLYNPIRKTLIARRERIAEGIRQAEMAKMAAAEAEQTKQQILEEARDEAQQIRATATRDADQATQSIRTRAEEDATEIRQRAQREAEAQKEAILLESQRQIAELAMLGAERILGRELQNPVDQEQFISSLMAEAKRS